MGYDAVILGAGPAGLAVAHAMLRAGAKVKVLEPAAHVGGSIRTHLDEGWIVETGPNTLQLEGAEDEALMAAYGLGEIMQSADMRAARRYIFARGELHGLGPSPLTLLTSKLLTWSGKLRLLSEPFRAKGGHAGETVVEFATRRFGPEAAAMLMDPIVSGVHAGDPARLVMASCFPRIHALEQTYGSVLNGLRRGPKTKRTVVGFPAGMRQLAEANRPHLANKPVEIFVEGLEGIIIEAPEAVLSVAIGNLLGNACKYTVEGEVRCRVEADHIAIEDTGPGLSTEDAERLFERGYRGSSVGNTTGGGIGLSIVRRLCELYGWKVSIAPREQGGAVAILRFS
jgi:protoporphyrinogen oxidase